jgi:hypothetical protein
MYLLANQHSALHYTQTGNTEKEKSILLKLDTLILIGGLLTWRFYRQINSLFCGQRSRTSPLEYSIFLCSSQEKQIPTRQKKRKRTVQYLAKVVVKK